MFHIDLRSLAIFRICLGALIAIDTLNRASDLAAHYGDAGVLPRFALIEKFINVHHVSIYLANGSEVFNGLMFAATIFFALAMMIGWRTRLMTVLSWYLMIALHARNPMILQAGDTLFRLLIFWSIFLPLGARFSVDAGVAPLSAVPAADRHVSLAGAGLLLQVASVYLFTVLQKTGSEWWRDGTAVYYALHIDIFATRPGVLIRQYPELLKLATFGSIIAEAAIPFLLLAPVWTTALRIVGVLAVLTMHASFGFFMELGNFPWIDWVSVLPFIPGAVWTWLATKLMTPERAGLVILVDPAREAVGRIASVGSVLFQVASLRPFDAPARATAAGRGWVVRDHTGRNLVGRAGLCAFLRQWPIFGPVLAWIGARLPGAFHMLVPSADRIERRVLRYEPRIELAHPIWTGLAGSALVVCIWWNLSTVPNLNVVVPTQIRWIGHVFRLDQNWSMFAPFPLKDDGWYVIEGKTVDDTPVDVYQLKIGPVNYDKPAHVADQFENQRWRKYMLNIWLASNAGHRLYLGRYLCRRWNATFTDDAMKLREHKIIYMREDTLPDYQQSEVKKVELRSHNCNN